MAPPTILVNSNVSVGRMTERSRSISASLAGGENSLIGFSTSYRASQRNAVHSEQPPPRRPLARARLETDMLAGQASLKRVVSRYRAVASGLL
jgi:hypothetical protein